MKQIKIAIVLFSYLVASCHKSTTIDGLVSDANTGAPIAGASVSINLLIDKGQANQESGSFHGKTDGNGRFYYENENILDIYYTEIRADKYGSVIYDFPEINAHECNKPEFKLIPRDGVLKIRLENTSGSTDSLFFYALNDCDYLYFHFANGQPSDPYPLWLGKDESHYAYFKTCRGKPTYLRWSFERTFANFQQDTVQIPIEDTTTYTFHY